MDLGTWVGAPASGEELEGAEGADTGICPYEFDSFDLKRMRPVRERRVKPEMERRGIMVLFEGVGEILVVSSRGG